MPDPLLERARNWDKQALTEIYDRYAPAIYRYAYRRLGREAVAQEIAAETFHRLLGALKNGGGPNQHLSGWLYRVAHNLVVDFYRGEPEEPKTSLDQVQLMTEAPSGETLVTQDEEAIRVRAALKRLTPLQQQVLTLRFLEDLSLKETAGILEKTVGAIKGLQYRAVQSLRRILEEDDET
jgi:RNA polymerase sigma-70 factor (ECF subfamily)